MGKNVAHYILARLQTEQGQDLIEYSLLSGIIATAIIGVVTLALTTGIQDMMTGIGECIDWDGVACLP